MKIITLLFSLFIIINCKSQKIKKMKTFDIELFNSLDSTNAKKLNKKYTAKKGDTIITMLETDNNFIEQKSHKDRENLTEVLVYNKDNLMLQSSQTRILDMPMRNYKEYDENGEIIKQINKNNYPFTLQDLINVAKIRYGIDLTKKCQRLSIGIIVEDDGSENYYIIYPVSYKNSNYFIKISTITGENVFETDSFHDVE